MKKTPILFLLILFQSFYLQSQQNPSKPAPQNSGQKKLGNTNQVQHLTQSILHEDCLRKQFSIVFYVVLDSSYTVGAATPTALTAMLNNINDKFKNICVTFSSCNTFSVPNYTYGRFWYYNSTESIVTASWYTPKTINVYLVDSVLYPVGQPTFEIGGYTYNPTAANLSHPKRDLIVLQKDLMLQNQSSYICHLLGHYFGLNHTSSEINPGNPANPLPPPGVISHEFANGSNCDSNNAPFPHGDGFCDTEADPGNDNIKYDGMGNLYARPRENLMSNYVGTRCKFSLQQYNYMANVILNLRFYLH